MVVSLLMLPLFGLFAVVVCLLRFRETRIEQAELATRMRTRKGIPTDQDLEALNETLPVLPAKASGLCVICLDEVSSGESVRELTCQHIFHAECLDTWWQRSARSRSTSIREISVTDNTGATSTGGCHWASGGAGRLSADPQIARVWVVGVLHHMDFLGLPPWALVGILVLFCLLCLGLPLLYWFRRQSNLRKEYIPRDQRSAGGRATKCAGFRAGGGERGHREWCASTKPPRTKLGGARGGCSCTCPAVPMAAREGKEMRPMAL
eukprot:g535.t1